MPHHVVRSRRLQAAVVVLLAILVVSGTPVVPEQAPPRVEVEQVHLAGSKAAVAERSRSLVTALGKSGVDPIDPAAPGWSAVVELPNDAQMVGLTWRGPAVAELRVRSHAANGWSQWVDVEGGLDEAPDAPEGGSGVRGVGPIWIGEGADRVQTEVRTGNLSDLTLHALESIEPSPSPFATTVAGAAAQPPNTVPRSAWGARDWAYATPGCEAGPRYAEPQFAIIHHTVNTNTYSAEQADDLIRGIQAFHMDAQGWCDIAYNFIVDRFGRRYEARAGGFDRGVIGGHARGFNTGSIGVALLGDHSKASVSVAAASAVRDLLAWKFYIHGIDSRTTIGYVSGCSTDGGYQCKYPAGTLVNLPTVVVHGDVTFTGCPGVARDIVPTLQVDVSDQVMRSSPFNPISGWTPSTAAPKVLTLDRWGGVHPAGGAASVPAAFGWPGFDIARGIAGTPTAGYVVDGFGGLAAYGSAPPQGSPVYWRGWDIVRSIASTGPASGYILDGWGGVHSFGGAPQAVGGPYWHGWDIARDLVTTPDGLGGYVLDGFGGVHSFGTAPPATGGPYWPGWDIARAIALRPDGPGGYVLDGWGGLHPFGGAPSIAVTHFTQGQDMHRDVVLLPGGGGYVLDSSGFLWPVGSSPPVTHSMTWTWMGLGEGLVASP